MNLPDQIFRRIYDDFNDAASVAQNFKLFGKEFNDIQGMNNALKFLLDYEATIIGFLTEYPFIGIEFDFEALDNSFFMVEFSANYELRHVFPIINNSQYRMMIMFCGSRIDCQINYGRMPLSPDVEWAINKEQELEENGHLSDLGKRGFYRIDTYNTVSQTLEYFSSDIQLSDIPFVCYPKGRW